MPSILTLIASYLLYTSMGTHHCHSGHFCGAISPATFITPSGVEVPLNSVNRDRLEDWAATALDPKAIDPQIACRGYTISNVKESKHGLTADLDLRGRVPVHRGSGRGVGNYALGQAGGAETVMLSASHLPAHTHALTATNDSANSQNPSGMVPARSSTDVFTAQASPLPMNANAITATGQSQPHDNVQPFQCVNFIIALEGIFPAKD